MIETNRLRGPNDDEEDAAESVVAAIKKSERNGSRFLMSGEEQNFSTSILGPMQLYCWVPPTPLFPPLPRLPLLLASCLLLSYLFPYYFRYKASNAKSAENRHGQRRRRRPPSYCANVRHSASIKAYKYRDYYY